MFINVKDVRDKELIINTDYIVCIEIESDFVDVCLLPITTGIHNKRISREEFDLKFDVFFKTANKSCFVYKLE